MDPNTAWTVPADVTSISIPGIGGGGGGGGCAITDTLEAGGQRRTGICEQRSCYSGETLTIL